MSQEFPELGIYTSPGRITDPQRTLGEATLAQQLGIGSIFSSVKLYFDYKL
jgi:hypothetical protein